MIFRRYAKKAIDFSNLSLVIYLAISALQIEVIDFFRAKIRYMRAESPNFAVSRMSYRGAFELLML